MNATEIKKNLKKDFHGITNISVTIGEHDDELDINVNVWGYDRWMNEEFECYSETLSIEEMKKAMTKAKRLATTFGNWGYKSKYNGIENC
jgi:hypothetical protein